jgi:hypothetical protein
MNQVIIRIGYLSIKHVLKPLDPQFTFKRFALCKIEIMSRIQYSRLVSSQNSVHKTVVCIPNCNRCHVVSYGWEQWDRIGCSFNLREVLAGGQYFTHKNRVDLDFGVVGN